jgi:hypothetical protein
MKKAILVLFGIMVISALAVGQERKGELFAGYSFTNQGLTSQLKPVGLDRVNANGWDASFAYRLNKVVGIKADFAGAYSGLDTAGTHVGDISMHTFLFGPQLRVPGEGRFSPFVHALFGVAHGKVTPNSNLVPIGSQSDNVFAMNFGGGFDVRLNAKIGWRSEIGLLHTRFDFGDNKGQNSLRMSTGLVFTF